MKEICKQHNRWINIVKQFGITDFSEDVVQEAYLKCLEKESINEAYFYLTLRSLAMDLHRKQKQIIKVSIDEVNLTNEIYTENNVINLVDEFYWFDKELFYLYYDSEMSMRDISKATGISLSSIYNTLKKCKDKIKKWDDDINIYNNKKI